MSPLGDIQKNAGEIDPRITELKQAGLPDCWIEIALAIGFEAFITMWAILDKDNLAAGNAAGTEARRLWVPMMNSYFRFQRNLYARELSLRGLTARQIQQRLREDTGEVLSMRTIERIIYRHRQVQWRPEKPE